MLALTYLLVARHAHNRLTEGMKPVGTLRFAPPYGVVRGAMRQIVRDSMTVLQTAA